MKHLTHTSAAPRGSCPPPRGAAKASPPGPLPPPPPPPGGGESQAVEDLHQLAGHRGRPERQRALLRLLPRPREEEERWTRSRGGQGRRRLRGGRLQGGRVEEEAGWRGGEPRERGREEAVLRERRVGGMGRGPGGERERFQAVELRRVKKKKYASKGKVGRREK